MKKNNNIEKNNQLNTVGDSAGAKSQTWGGFHCNLYVVVLWWLIVKF